ncbi:transcriptional modulator of MazE/toxin, MazF [Candidatus Thiomargarita nelsonii]|uniref:Transcriptional modulator of MazE/toxin, MazF n=1 Tax=Candidatus Thiomargarita nelsonii TaxID=1003181 RepID=A0A176RSW3_9GAMM|nr:transcriptional modulator of MazE/toxin, MazF [Candidatus Thiomargarita nelsonii]
MNLPGKIRVDKIYTLSQSIVFKKFGQVNVNVLNRIRSLLQNLSAAM